MYDDHIKCVEKLLTKDADSWDCVMHRYVPFLQTMAVKAGLDDDEARESVQDTLASLWEEDAKILRDYEGRASFRTYLASVVHRDCLDFLRRKKREWRKVKMKTDAYLIKGTKGLKEKIEERFDIELLLDNLDSKGKLLVKLIYYDGLSSEEIAVIFRASASTVDVWHFRLREKLRKLAGVGESPETEKGRGSGGEVS